MISVPEPISFPTQSESRRKALGMTLDRWAFVMLIVLALTFAFEMPFGSQLVGETTITSTKILQVMVIGLWLGAHAINRTWPRVPRRLLLPICIWLGVLLISALLNPDYLIHSLRFLSRIVLGILLAWVGYDLANTAKRWRTVILSLIIAGVLVSVLGLGEAIGMPVVLDFLHYFRSSQTHVGDIVRVTASLSYATITAMVLEMIVPLTMAWLIVAEQRWLKALLVISLFIDTLVMMFTLTRSAILGLSIALVVIIVVSYLYHRLDVVRAAIVTFGIIIVSTLILLALNPLVGLRLLTENENGWYQARYNAPNAITARPNELVQVPIQLTNTGLHSWTAQTDPAFHLGFTLIQPNNPTFKPLDGPRTALPSDVLSGEIITVNAQVPAPSTPGEYQLQWDMVEEKVLWFSWRGSTLGHTQLIVVGDPIALSAPRPSLGIANHSSAAPPLERQTLWSMALRMFRDKPILGIGPDNFRWAYGHYLNLAHWDTNVHANSIYFEWLADTGLIGLLVFLWLNGQWLRTAWQGISCQTDSKLWIWQLALFASLIAWFVHGFLDYFYEFAGTYILFWLIAGLAINTATYRSTVTESIR